MGKAFTIFPAPSLCCSPRSAAEVSKARSPESRQGEQMLQNGCCYYFHLNTREAQKLLLTFNTRVDTVPSFSLCIRQARVMSQGVLEEDRVLQRGLRPGFPSCSFAFDICVPRYRDLQMMLSGFNQIKLPLTGKTRFPAEKVLTESSVTNVSGQADESWDSDSWYVASYKVKNKTHLRC